MMGTTVGEAKELLNNDAYCEFFEWHYQEYITELKEINQTGQEVDRMTYFLNNYDFLLEKFNTNGGYK